MLVVGLGKSGMASALFLRKRGARVTVSDSQPQSHLSQQVSEMLVRGIVVETGTHGEQTFRDQDLIVVSPGVPMNIAALAAARSLGIPVIGEIELAANFFHGPIVGITGSNGKTTTTTLIGEILAKSGQPVLVGGNIGIPAIELVPSEPASSRHLVLELSSFQLETISTFHPKVAVLLNITPDHLDRHLSFEAYAAAKARIFENQEASDFAVLNADDVACAAMAKNIRSNICWFSTRRENKPGAFLRSGDIYVEVPAAMEPGYQSARQSTGEHFIMPAAEIGLKGKHNRENVLAAICVAWIAGCPGDAIRRAVREFKAVEHRLEHVTTIRGVEYYNDSKATNVDATIKALEPFSANIHLVLGGKDKGSDYSILTPLLQGRVKSVYTIGAAAEKIASQIAGAATIVRAITMQGAVRAAAATAAPGDIVLLSPACASFDQFDNYEHRGRVFKELVMALESKPAQSVIPAAANRRANG